MSWIHVALARSKTYDDELIDAQKESRMTRSQEASYAQQIFFRSILEHSTIASYEHEALTEHESKRWDQKSKRASVH